MYSTCTGPIAGGVVGVLVLVIAGGTGSTVVIVIVIVKKKDEDEKDQNKQTSPSHVCKCSCLHRCTVNTDTCRRAHAECMLTTTHTYTYRDMKVYVYTVILYTCTHTENTQLGRFICHVLCIVYYSLAKGLLDHCQLLQKKRKKMLRLRKNSQNRQTRLQHSVLNSMTLLSWTSALIVRIVQYLLHKMKCL